MSDSNDATRKAKSARRKRLKLLRKRSRIDNLTTELDQNFVLDTAACGWKKRRANNAIFSSFSERDKAPLEEEEEEIGDELIELAREEERSSETRLNYVSYGLISVIGRKRFMEAAVTVVPDGEFAIFAVYGGHGGERISTVYRDRLHKLVLEETDGKMLDGCTGEFRWEKVMKECFAKLDEEVKGGGGGGPTAVVAIVAKDEVVVANCGDSRAVLCCGGVPVPLSRDHNVIKPNKMDGRVLAGGGSRVLGVLAPSTSIGDKCLKPSVIAKPEVNVSKRTVSDEFLIIATNGLWDVVPSEFACDIVRKCLHGQLRIGPAEGSNADMAAALLAKLALAKGSQDNISVIVVELKR